MRTRQQSKLMGLEMLEPPAESTRRAEDHAPTVIIQSKSPKPMQAQIPGQQIGSGDPGSGAFEDGQGSLRAAVIGEVTEDGGKVSVRPAKLAPVAQTGDTIVGIVAAVMAYRFAVTIHYVNGRKITSHVECMCTTRNRRERIVALAGDLVQLKIKSKLNGDTHADIDGPELGVLHTSCRKCGSRVINIRDGVKCAECGWMDDRKLAENFGDQQYISSLLGQ